MKPKEKICKQKRKQAGSEDLYHMIASKVDIYSYIICAVLVPYVNALITCMILRNHYTRLIITYDNWTKP